MWGFNDLKDVLDVLIVPSVIFVLGVLLPRLLEHQRRKSFINLIRREFSEMAPDPKSPEANKKWTAHLKKRFIHEDIFEKPSENRDFILSLPVDLSYNMAQLWIHYKKATEVENSAEVAEHGCRWCDYLKEACRILDGKKVGNQKDGKLHKAVYEPWQNLIDEYKRFPYTARTGARRIASIFSCIAFKRFG